MQQNNEPGGYGSRYRPAGTPISSLRASPGSPGSQLGRKGRNRPERVRRRPRVPSRALHLRVAAPSYDPIQPPAPVWDFTLPDLDFTLPDLAVFFVSVLLLVMKTRRRADVPAAAPIQISLVKSIDPGHGALQSRD